MKKSIFLMCWLLDIIIIKFLIYYSKFYTRYCLSMTINSSLWRYYFCFIIFLLLSQLLPINHSDKLLQVHGHRVRIPA